MAPNRNQPKLYTARSQFWFGQLLFKPIDMGGRALDEGDPILASHPHMFEEYHPRTRDYGQESPERPTRIARIEAPEEVPAKREPAHTHPH
jgi:hypothetical protein